jgi:hypothetical protein
MARSEIQRQMIEAPASARGPSPAEAEASSAGARPPHERPSWTITKLASTGVIVLRFVGPTRTGEAPEFLSALSDMMPDENANIIFDLRELDGHNPETKQPIKKWLLANKSRIASLTVVVARYATLIKIATAVIGLATGIRIKIRDDLDGEASLRNL